LLIFGQIDMRELYSTLEQSDQRRQAVWSIVDIINLL